GKNPAPIGTTWRTTSARPLSDTAPTTIPSPSTNTQNDGAVAWNTRPTPVRRRTIRYPARTTAPTVATHTGPRPSGEATPKPRTLRTTTVVANRGTRTAAGTCAAASGAPRSRPKTSINPAVSTTTTTSQGSTIKAANRRNVTGSTANA